MKARMTREALDRWLKALRSDKYRQTRQQLINPAGDAYCCLGVLLVTQDKPVKDPKLTTENYPAVYEVLGLPAPATAAGSPGSG